MYLSNSLKITSKACEIRCSLTFSSITEIAFSRLGTLVPFCFNLICAPMSGLIILPTVNKNTCSKRSITSLVSFFSFSFETTSYFKALPQDFFILFSFFPSPSCKVLKMSRFLKDPWSLAMNFHLRAFKRTFISDSSLDSLSYLTKPLRILKKFSLACSSKCSPHPFKSSR